MTLIEKFHNLKNKAHSLSNSVLSLRNNTLFGDLHLGGFDKFINDRITSVFPDTIPPKITHSLFVSQENIFRHKNIYPNELPGTESKEVKEAYYDLGAETVNYWLLNEACSLVLDNLPPGMAHGLKGLSSIYHLDSNPGYKELEKMGKSSTPKNLKSVINKTLFSHDPGELTQYWNTHNRKKNTVPGNLTTEDFILDIGRLACPVPLDLDDKKRRSKILSKIQGAQLIPNYLFDIEAAEVTQREMIKPEWINFFTLAELFGSASLALSSQPLLSSLFLGASTLQIGSSILDGIHKNIYMRSLSETHFGIREIEWNKEVK